MRTIVSALLILHCVMFPGCATPAPTAQHHTAHHATSAAVLPSDFDILQGGPWSGTLTYLDYSSGKTTTIRSTLQVTRIAEGSWKFSVGYNDEPHANAADEVRLDDAGHVIRSGDTIEHVITRTATGNSIEITTEHPGEDNGSPALIRRVRTITPHDYSLAKHVRPEGQQTFFKRHEYRWMRK